jgi:ribonuclease HI
VPADTCHAWTDGSFRRSAGFGFVITRDDLAASPPIAQRSSMRSFRELGAALIWHLQGSHHKHMVIHSDSTSAIARAGHSGTGPGQRIARDIQRSVKALVAMSRSAQIVWVKGHSGIPGNEKADTLAGQEAEKVVSSTVMSIPLLRFRSRRDIVKRKTKRKRGGSWQ